jgi:hypothetical protein
LYERLIIGKNKNDTMKDVQKRTNYREIGRFGKKPICVGILRTDHNKHMGKDKEGVIFPVAPNLSEMSDGYLDFIEEVKKEIQKQRISVVLNANSSMICL